MKGYYQQHGCHDCAHVFIRQEYEDGPEFFCACDGPRPAVCGSSLMDESFFRRSAEEHYGHRDEEESDKLMATWDAWADAHRVRAWGTCPRWVLCLEMSGKTL